MNSYPDIFASGMPACGKSDFGDWLSTNHGYLHIDFEKRETYHFERFKREIYLLIERVHAKPLIEVLREEKKPIYFNWGFPMTSIHLAADLASLLMPVWFYADDTLSREAFIHRGGIPIAAFDKQMRDISSYGSALDSIFGANTIRSITSDGHLSPEEIWKQIQDFNTAEPSAAANA